MQEFAPNVISFASELKIANAAGWSSDDFQSSSISYKASTIVDLG
jgi:hypothetical protein